MVFGMDFGGGRRNKARNYTPDPMGRVGFGTATDEEDRDPLGRLTAPEPDDSGPKARRAWRSGNPGAVAAEALKGVSKPVGPTGDNEPEDVGKIEALVADAGTHDVKKTDGPTGYFGQTLDQGIKAFQQAKGLKVDGLVNPGGPTETALKANTQANLAKGGIAVAQAGAAEHSSSTTGNSAVERGNGSAGDVYTYPDGPFKITSNTPLSEETLEFIRSLDKGYEPPGPVEQGLKDLFLRFRDLVNELRPEQPNQPNRVAGDVRG